MDTPAPLTLRNCAINPPLLLAPMMDITGCAFRSLVREYGGCGLFYSEMLNSRRVPRERDDSPIFAGFGQEEQLVLQLLGDDPQQLRESVLRLEAFQPAGFDLNMGCTRTAITRHGWGAALLGNPRAAAAAIRAMRQATEKCLTVKIRNAWPDPRQGSAFLDMLEAEGADAIIVHPRSLEKRFARPAQWAWIREVKAKLNIPIIGNGDVLTAQDVLTMFQETGCDAVMIGRAAVHHPTIFREAEALLRGWQPEPAPSALTIFEQYLDYLGPELKTVPKRFSELKTFCEYFAQGLPVPHWFWGPIQGSEDVDTIVKKSMEFLARNKL